MFRRSVRLSKNHSFFLFGPRGSGKSTLLRQSIQTDRTFYVDLLLDQHESRYRRDPDLFAADVRARPQSDWIVVDEVQKLPKLLDIVHALIEERRGPFILTGSSARKLKRGGANLLAGRAFLYHLFPLTYLELGKRFDLSEVLHWGSLPKIFSLSQEDDRRSYLRSYARTYMREEILQEQLVRNGSGFQNFLDVAVQMNGKALNFSKIARESGVDSKTVRSYYEILEDTLLGFFLPAFHRSVRKAQTMQPKFYFFDLGVARAIEGSLDSAPVPRTSGYGQLFEQLVVLEAHRLNSYFDKDYRLSHYRTSTGQEIDLMLMKGRKLIAAEIKSTNRIDAKEASEFERLARGVGATQMYLVSQDPTRSRIGDVACLEWREFLSEIFVSP